MQSTDGTASINPVEYALKRRSSWFPFALCAITVLALGLRLYHLDAESLCMDEFWQVGSYSLPVSYVVTRAADQGYPPLDYLIGVGLDRIGLADSDWWVRFPAAIFGAGGVWLLGVWLRRVGGDFVGVTSAALLAVCPLHVFMSQEARPYTIFMFFALATVLAFCRARKHNTFTSWCFYGAMLLMTLLTRWDGPHFILASIALFSTGVWLRTRYLSYSPIATVAREDARFRAAFIASIVAVACDNLVFGIVLEHNRRALGTVDGGFWNTAWTTMCSAYTAMFHGYSPRTLSARDGSGFVLATGLVLGTAGLLAVIRALRRRHDDAVWLFLLVAVPFPILYAVVYACLSAFRPKPQYLLFLAVPLFGAVALGLDALRRSVAQRTRTAATIATALATVLVLIPMSRASVASITTVERRDWRGVYRFLRTHASPEDAFAAVASQTIPVYYQPVTPGMERYLRRPVRFLKITLDTALSELDTPAWKRRAGTVWVLCYTNRLYLPDGQVPVPVETPAGTSVHRYNGLFLLEARGATPARDRLITALAALYPDVPNGHALIAPALLLQRYHAARGELDLALLWRHKAVAQILPGNSIELLAARFAPVAPADDAPSPPEGPGDVAVAGTSIPNTGG